MRCETDYEGTWNVWEINTSKIDQNKEERLGLLE